MEAQVESTPAAGEPKKISLAALSEMTGFPMELIQQELFLGETGEVSLEDLRAAMLSYIDSTMLVKAE